MKRTPPHPTACIHLCRRLSPSLRVLLVPLALLAPAGHAEESFSVGFLNPAVESTSPFFNTVETTLRAAAKDLDIDLHIVYGKNSSVRMRRVSTELMDNVKPDYFLTGYYMGMTDFFMEHTSNLPVKIFVVTVPPDPREVLKTGKPRGRHKHWIGQLTTEEQELGNLQAELLIKEAKESGLVDNRNRVNIAALIGFDQEDEISKSRMEGLKKRIDEGNDAVLVESIPASWNPELAYKYTLEMLRKNPSIHVIWSVTDDMARGAMRAIEEAGKYPGKDILVGGIDLDRKAIDYIESGEQTVSVGGHFIEATLALAMVYDYHRGTDFGNTGKYIFKSQAVHAVTQENVADFRKYFMPQDWNTVDFRQFTKTHNPDLKEYPFSLEAFQKILEKKNE